ncbi:hypothetical protein K504DRAFT_507077 [Pleomassaria siparia CBS 279.74]|uniref:Uncharacterized protein n=1 Tax=Pleomassaria siparia CBS 279.74 TaxID=1314801 RepID=A0A6G1JVG9_9PLEO|nr:hypothetical protein K504DRAFT_507077 [Pleomassaria siparia CBS 279.74]
MQAADDDDEDEDEDEEEDEDHIDGHWTTHALASESAPPPQTPSLFLLLQAREEIDGYASLRIHSLCALAVSSSRLDASFRGPDLFPSASKPPFSEHSTLFTQGI